MLDLQADCMTYPRLLLVCLQHRYPIVGLKLIQLPWGSHDQEFKLLWLVDWVDVTPCYSRCQLIWLTWLVVGMCWYHTHTTAPWSAYGNIKT